MINRGTINSSGKSSSINWTNILLLIFIGIFLLLPVSSIAANITQKRQNVASVVNLTSSPGEEMIPQWSPDGNFIAFTSDAIDSNNDGKLDTVVLNNRYLYIIRPDGTGLKKYSLQIGKVQSFVWSTVPIAHDVNTPAYGIFAIIDTGTDFSPKNSLNYFTQATLPFNRVWPSDVNVEQPQAINSACISKDGRTLFFDMLTMVNAWDIYKLSIVWTGAVPSVATGDLSVPQRLTNATAGKSFKSPSIANNGTEIIYEYTDQLALDSLSHIYKMTSGGTLQSQLTNGNGDDTQPKYTQDGMLLFTSNRSTENGDTITNKNVWRMKYGEEGTGDPIITPEPRLFNNPTIFSNQFSASPQIGLGKPGDIVFISDSDKDLYGNINHDLFISTLTDVQTPYVSSAPVITPREATPGSIMNVNVRIASFNSVRNVWMQIKDPDTDTTDKEGIDHVITLDDATLGETSPLDFGPYNIQKGEYLDIHNGSNGYPGYYTQNSNLRLFSASNDGDGYPEVPEHWIKLYDDGLHNDLNANDGVFGCTWQAPTVDSDWYIDIIVEDTINLMQDGSNAWHGNRRRYDNIGGFTTSPFTGGHAILFVDDYIDGQKFLSSGTTGAVAQYDPILYTNSPYYFRTDSPLALNRVDSTATFTFTPGADIWRVLCRGRIPDTTLNSYLPEERTYVSSLDGSTQILSTGHGSKIVVWASPFPASRMMTNPGNGTGIGSLIEKRTQDSLKAFVQSGGRLLLMGSDLVQDLTQKGTAQNTFLAEIAGIKPSTSFTVTPSGPDAITTLTNWYGTSLASSAISGGAAIVRNSNLSQYTISAPISSDLCWDQVQLTNSGKGAMVLTSANTQGMTRATTNYLAVSREDITKNGRVVTFTFSPDNVVLSDRYKLLNDTFEWLFDAAVQGIVMNQSEGDSPLSNILVTISESTKTIVTNPDGTSTTKYSKSRDLYSVKTGNSGYYFFGGLRPGKVYIVTVNPNGYLGTSQLFTPSLRGGSVYKGADINFRLLRNPDKSSIYGTVRSVDGLTIAGANVSATPLSNGSAVNVKTDNAGVYTINNLEMGAYLIKATNPLNGSSITELKILDGVAGIPFDLRMGSNQPIPGVLSGIILGGNEPLRGITVTATINNVSYDTLTDLDGKFSYYNLTDGDIQLQTTPAGYIGVAVEVKGYTNAIGAIISPIVLTSSNQSGTGTTSIQGKVYDGSSVKPLGGAKVSVYTNGILYQTILTSSSFSGDNGGYNYKVSVPAGTYKLKIEMQGRKSSDEMILSVATDEVKIINFNLQPFYTIPSGINMFSIPGDFAGASMATIFGLSIIDIDLLNGRIAADYNNLSGTYNLFSSSSPYSIATGKGYWSNFVTSKPVNIISSIVDNTKPYSMSLNSGWTLIGNPFDYTVSLTSSNIEINGITKTWNQAVSDNNVSPSVYGWSVEPWTGIGSYSTSIFIEPYKAYWVFSPQICSLQLSNIQARSLTLNKSVNGWISSINVLANNGELSRNYFGIVKDASNSFDNKFDSRTPPLSPGNKLRSGFIHSDWGGASGSYISDIRNSMLNEWKLQVDSVNPGSAVLLNWKSLAKDLSGSYEIYLTDEENGKIVSMNTMSQYQYVQDLNRSTTRTFKISVSKRSNSISVSNIRLLKSVRNNLVTFDSTVSGNAAITIRSITGNQLLNAKMDVSPGTNSWNWSSSDLSGKILQNGHYICEIKLSDQTGRSARAVGYLALVGR